MCQRIGDDVEGFAQKIAQGERVCTLRVLRMPVEKLYQIDAVVARASSDSGWAKVVKWEAFAESREAKPCSGVGAYIAAENNRLTIGPYLLIHPLTQFFPGLEVRNVFRGNPNLFARLGIAPGAGRAVIEPKTAEATDFNAPTLGKGIRHFFQHQPDRELDITGR